MEVVKSRDICNLLKWEAARCEGLHVAYHRKRGGSEGFKAFGLSRWKDGIDINWLRSERDWGKIMGTASFRKNNISINIIIVIFIIVLLFSSEQSDDMSPDYNSEEAVNGDLKESWVDVQLFEDLTKARIKFRVLEDLMHCLSFRHPAVSVHKLKCWSYLDNRAFFHMKLSCSLCYCLEKIHVLWWSVEWLAWLII